MGEDVRLAGSGSLGPVSIRRGVERPVPEVALRAQRSSAVYAASLDCQQQKCW